MKELLANSQPTLIGMQEKISALTIKLQSPPDPNQPRGLGKMTSVVIDREIDDWNRFNNRRQVGSYTGLCPGEYSSGNTRLQSCVTKHGNGALARCAGGIGLASGPLPAQLQTDCKMATDPR